MTEEVRLAAETEPVGRKITVEGATYEVVRDDPWPGKSWRCVAGEGRHVTRDCNRTLIYDPTNAELHDAGP